MKKLNQIFILLLISIFLLGNNVIIAQTTKEEKKEQKEQKKDQQETKDELYKKAGKIARKEEKKLIKQGWQTMGLPIAKQLEQTWMKMYETEPNGYPRYIWAQEMVTANTYAAAQSQADNIAKLRIASQISSSIGALVDIALANQEISAKEAASITKVVENSKILVSQKLGRVFKTMEIFKIVDGNYQMRTTICYDMKAAITIAKEIILEELKNDSEVNKAQLEKIMGMDNLIDNVQKNQPTFDEVVE